MLGQAAAAATPLHRQGAFFSDLHNFSPRGAVHLLLVASSPQLTELCLQKYVPTDSLIAYKNRKIGYESIPGSLCVDALPADTSESGHCRVQTETFVPLQRLQDPGQVWPQYARKFVDNRLRLATQLPVAAPSTGIPDARPGDSRQGRRHLASFTV